ncbi:hypothetical protein GCM10011319_19110 [Mameliella alba]|nr:hypothetical protein [Mameliella alba]GGF58004.1 hypothetical protein GCM10011319_19110 [Mameliella alba]
MPVASDPALGSVSASAASPPLTITGSQRFFWSWLAKSTNGLMAWKFVAQTIPVEAQAFGTSRQMARQAGQDNPAPW